MKTWLIETRGKRMTGGWTKWSPYYIGGSTKERALRKLDPNTLTTEYRVKEYKRIK